MSGADDWTEGELSVIGNAVELELATRKVDGSLRPYTTMWVVRVGDGIYVRSAGGPTRGWYRHALTSGKGRVRAGGIERDVRFDQDISSPHSDIDRTYHAKYDRYGPGPVSHVTGPGSHPVTIRLIRSQS
ncbi:DUF2255 family protein [Skermania sp. ID1734]|uniref:DUF2255 family protein n=1 Tax=Skermania sp. ID1734 TaxID=2597516 RepID=UPI00117DA7A6|nr:DUF2255 family protein [Skermania sp. ID1734]TSD99234.1 DUF2255 family protein [Skermania sp. ID1734]